MNKIVSGVYDHLETTDIIPPADKGPVTVVIDKADYFDKMDALVSTTNKLTKNLNATRRQHFNVNLTAKYLRLIKRLTLLTLNATID